VTGSDESRNEGVRFALLTILVRNLGRIVASLVVMANTEGIWRHIEGKKKFLDKNCRIGIMSVFCFAVFWRIYYTDRLLELHPSWTKGEEKEGGDRKRNGREGEKKGERKNVEV